MPQFMVLGKDGPQGPDGRAKHRPAHLEHWGRLHAAGELSFAGPLLDAPNGTPIGSLIIFDAGTEAEARALMEADPYVTGGVFASVELHPVRQVLPAH